MEPEVQPYFCGDCSEDFYEDHDKECIRRNGCCSNCNKFREIERITNTDTNRDKVTIPGESEIACLSEE